MIWLDDNGKIVIRTEIEADNVCEIHLMKQTVLNLLSTQDDNFRDRQESYWAFELVKLLEPSPEQICLKQE
jgi:hypothetical protein